MNVAVISSSTRAVGGTEVYVRACTDALRTQGHSVTLVSAVPDDAYSPPGVDRLSLPALFSASLRPGHLRSGVRAARALIGELRRRAVGLVLVHDVGSLGALTSLTGSLPTVRFVHTAWPYCPAGTLWLPRTNTACVRRPGLRCLQVHAREACMTTQEGNVFPAATMARRILEMRVEAWLMRRCVSVVANSTYMAERLRLFTGGHRGIRVIAPPVRSSLAPDRTPEPGLLLAVGRMVRLKGLADAIRVVAGTAGARLRLVGDGPLRADLERLARALGVADRVEFLGWLDKAGVDAELLRAQVILFTSHGPETFGQVGPEAAVCGRPVVGYDTGGVSSWLGPEVGCLVPSGDLRALTTAVQGLLRDPERCRRLGEQARRGAARFSFERFATELQALTREASSLA